MTTNAVATTRRTRSAVSSTTSSANRSSSASFSRKASAAPTANKHGDQPVDRAVREHVEEPDADTHRDRDVHGERERGADPHRERATARREQERGEHRLVGQLAEEDQREHRQDDPETHPGVLPDRHDPSGLLDRDDGPGARVELVQVLADAVAVRSVVVPAGETLVDDRGVRLTPAGPGETRRISASSSCTRPSLSVACTCVAVCVTPSSASSVVTFHSRMLEWAPSVHTQPRWRSPASVPIRMPPKWVSSPMLIENQRHIVGPPHRRGPHDLSRLPARVDELVAGAVDVDPAGPPTRLFEMPLPTMAPRRRARAAVLERPWPSTPTAGVRASNVRSSATPVGVGGEPPRLHRREPLVAHAADRRDRRRSSRAARGSR